MHQSQEAPKDRLNLAINRHKYPARNSFIFAALLAGFVFTIPLTGGVNAQIVGPLAPGTISEDIDEAAACAEMLAVTSALAGPGLNNTTVCGEMPSQFSFESDQLNETVDVTQEELNLDNFIEDDPKIDVPTGAKASPLFGALPFTMQMLREEEMGPVKLQDKAYMRAGPEFPRPTGFHSGPTEQSLDDFLSYYVKPHHVYGGRRGGALPYPWPTEYANDPDDPGYAAEAGLPGMENPWKADIEAYIGRTLNTPPAEGRAPGIDWAHQRWNEFYPQVYVNTAQAGARTNTGLRDRLQSHNYQSGEWGPGGLYWTIARGMDANGNEELIQGTTSGIPARFHPKFPIQDPNALWTWDGTFPPKLMKARYGEGLLLRHYNALPVDPASNYGFGLHTLTTHEHNGHNPAESDGYTQAFFFPGQFFDYHWPMIPAGYDHINQGATDPRAATPCVDGEVLKIGGVDKTCVDGTIKIPGDYKEIMSTHWFHDHMLDFTAQNVYKGNAAMFNYYSAIDRAKEEHVEQKCHYQNQNNVNLCLPSGTELPWGNRDYDINLMLQDKAWDSDGQLFFNVFNTDGFMGDQILTNLTWKPYFNVRARRYRLRLLNASVSRYMRLALVERVEGAGGEIAGPQGSNVSYNRVPFYMIANDGNIMEHAVHFDGNKTVAGYQNRKGILPTQGIAERYDIIVDFSQFAPGTKLYIVNLLEHRNGRRPHEEIPLEEVLNGEYHERDEGGRADLADVPTPVGGRYDSDPAVARFLEFIVHPYTEDGTPTGTPKVDGSMDPALYVEGGLKMMPLPTFTQEELDNAIHRTFEFARSNGTDENPWTIKTDGGAGYNMDPRRLSAAPAENQVEIWHIEGNGGWSHPVHVHFEEGQILTRGGLEPPEWEKWARKDIYRIGRMEDSTDSVTMAIRFREFLGTYMEHCHNTQHEDHAMLLRWDVENPGQVKIMPTPMPTWDGVGYVASTALPTFRTGDPNPGADDGVSPLPPTVSIAPPNPAGVAPFLVFFGAPASDPDGVIVSTFWNFGDGIVSTSPNSVGHVFNTPGTYTTTVTVTDDGGNTASASTTVTVSGPPGANMAPTVSITPLNPTGAAPLTVNFGANASDADGTIASYAWTFGDGGTSTGATPSHTYTTPGSYLATVTVTDDDGALASTVTTVTVTEDEEEEVPNVPPTVSIAPQNPAGVAPFLVFFGAPASDPDGVIVSTFWDFGDGGVSTSPNSVGHVFASPGTYVTTVTVTDDGGDTASASTTVTVTGAPGSNAPPTVSMLPLNPTGEAPLSVNFGAAAADTDGTIASYAWTFGDGSTGTGAAPSHVYTTPGTYTATVTVTDDDGAPASAFTTVTVNAVDEEEDETPPVVTAPADITAVEGDPIVLGTATAVDDVDGPLTATPTTTGPFPLGTTIVVWSATDAEGNTGTDTQLVTVSPAGPNVAPTVSLSPLDPRGVAPFTVPFAAVAADTDGTIVSIVWTFGDGGTTTGASPAYTYTVPGNYTATVTVTDDDGATATASTLVRLR